MEYLKPKDENKPIKYDKLDQFIQSQNEESAKRIREGIRKAERDYYQRCGGNKGEVR